MDAGIVGIFHSKPYRVGRHSDALNGDTYAGVRGTRHDVIAPMNRSEGLNAASAAEADGNVLRQICAEEIFSIRCRVAADQMGKFVGMNTNDTITCHSLDVLFPAGMSIQRNDVSRLRAFPAREKLGVIVVDSLIDPAPGYVIRGGNGIEMCIAALFVEEPNSKRPDIRPPLFLRYLDVPIATKSIILRLWS